nr:hypothetical protein [Tanacetum cinerariifolium]
MQTQTSNSLYNAIMEAGSKDRPPMLAPGNYIQWKSRIKRYIDTKPNRELIHYCLENPPYELGWKDKFILDAKGNPTIATHQVFETYNNVSQEIRDQLSPEAEAVQIILTGIDNDIYSTVDACPNACEMWKAIERIKQEWQRFVTLVKQSQGLKHVSYHKLYDILKQHQHEVNEIRAEKIARVANPIALVPQQQQVYHPETHPIHFNQHSSTKTHQATTRHRGKAVVNSPQPIYDQEPSMVDDDEDTSKDKEIDKLMDLISLSFKKIYKPTNNNLRTSSNTSRANQDNSPQIHRNAGYEGQRSGTVAGARDTVGSSMVQKFGIQCYNCKEYGHVARECQKPKRAKDAAYHREKMLLCKQEEAGIQNAGYEGQRSGTVAGARDTVDAQNVLIESVDMNYDSEQIDQNDEDIDLTKEQLQLRNSVEYASEMELECAKAKGELLSYKMEYSRAYNKYTPTINDLNQTDSKLNDKLSAQQDTISILKQQKDAQIKLYKTREDKEIEKVIDLLNKVKVLDNIVYKTGQSVQTMNMLNNKCRTSFAKPEYLKKAKQANPRLE